MKKLIRCDFIKGIAPAAPLRASSGFTRPPQGNTTKIQHSKPFGKTEFMVSEISVGSAQFEKKNEL